MAIFTAIGGAIFGAGTFLATLTAGALQVAAGIGLSLIAKSMAGKPEPQKFGIQTRLQGGDDVPRSIIFGKTATSGSLVYANTWGQVNNTPNGFLTQVVALADYPIQSLDKVFVDGQPMNLGSTPHSSFGYPILEYRTGGVDHLWVKFYNGWQTSADSFLVSSVSNSDRPYQSSRVGRGIPYVIATCRAPVRDDEGNVPVFKNGVPKFMFEVTGAALYDISKDSSVGGDGTHRYNDPSTWGGDGDHLPIVQAYAIMRGIKWENDWLYGLQQINASQLPSAAWINSINKCRLLIDGDIQYRSGGEIQVGANIKDSLEALLTACQGRISEIGGTYKPYIGEPEPAVISFSDDDIISTEEQMFTPFFGLEDSINGILAKFPNPDEAWAIKTAPPLIRTDLEALDGNRRLMANVSLDFVPYKIQVQRLIKSALLEAQRARRHTIVLGPEFWVVEPGDIIQWTSVRNGYEDKLFRVDGVSDRENLDVMIDITEVDPSDYDWNQSTDYTPVSDGPIQLVGTPPLPMIGWQVFPATIRDEQERERRPSIEVWYASGISDVARVRVQVRVLGEENPMFDGEVPYGEPWRTILWGQFSPNTEYEVRGRFIRDSGLDAEWSDWLSVTTPNVKLIPGEDFDPYSGVTGFEQLADDLDGYQTWLGQNIREIIEQAQAQATLTADQELANSLQFDEMRRSLGVQLGSLTATFEEVVTTAIIPMQGELVAIADALTQLSAGDGVDVNTARFRMSVMTGVAGYSRIGAETRVDVADPNAWRGASWWLDTPNDPMLPTRFMVVADQFIVVNPNDSEDFDSPLIFESGILRLNVANIGTVNAGLIQSDDGYSFWNLNTGEFQIGMEV